MGSALLGSVAGTVILGDIIGINRWFNPASYSTNLQTWWFAASFTISTVAIVAGIGVGLIALYDWANSDERS